MPDLRQTRKHMKTALAILVGVDVLAAIVYFSPLVGSVATRRQQLSLLQTEMNAKTRQVAPLKDLPQKVVLARREINDFYKRFPSQNSQILSELGKLSSSNGVSILHVTYNYNTKEAEEAGLQPVEMEATLVGNYTGMARFINALERDEMFFIINSITLGGMPQGSVNLTMKLETYLKVGT